MGILRILFRITLSFKEELVRKNFVLSHLCGFAVQGSQVLERSERMAYFMINAVKDKICMVTGGGGSIGSEIVRNLLRLDAKKVIAVDISEYGLHELITDTDGVITEIASIRDEAKMEKLFINYRPEIIFHAAAHKHVSFMEHNPEEAVKNNIRGTHIVCSLAEKYGAEKFILISTDKAVEPISVMGASKRVCEMMLCEMSKSSKMALAVVRFGNVTASSGSVIPLFEKQIDRGVVTVTDREVSRYFMSIPHAARLITAAAGVMKSGDVFVPEMGESVKIYDLAKKMIRESGKKAEIKITSLPKGDKLKEKLFYDFEKKSESGIDGLYLTRGSSIDGLWKKIDALYDLAQKNDGTAICELLMKITN